jgi:cell division transport system ATP-binding protein
MGGAEFGMALAPQSAARPVVDLQHVWKRYPNGSEALRDVSLTVPAGDFVFLVGPSGAGKTTLIRLLIREERATHGKVFVHDVDLSRIRRWRLPHHRRKVGLVFQDFKLLPRLTVFENVAFALRVNGESKQAITARVRQVLDTVGLADKARKYPSELSGGEQQRVGIARAIVPSPALLVADEPTGNVDPATAWDIMQLLLRINRDGATVLMATHNREIVDVLKRRVVALERGQIVRDDRGGTYAEIGNAETVQAPAVRD